MPKRGGCICIQSVLADNGIVLPRVVKNHLLSEKEGKPMLEELDVSEVSRQIQDCSHPEALWNHEEDAA